MRKVRRRRAKSIPVQSNPAGQSGSTVHGRSLSPPPLQLEASEDVATEKNKDLLYPYSPAELVSLIDRMATQNKWDADKKRQVSFEWLLYGLKINQAYASPAYLQQFKKEMLTSFPDIGPEVLLRGALFEQFSHFEGHGVEERKEGAPKPVFDDIISAVDHKKTKDNPATSTYTTCVDVQRILLQRAFEQAGQQIRKSHRYKQVDKSGKTKPADNSKWVPDRIEQSGDELQENFLFYGFGMQQAKELGAWHGARKNMSERPKPGDVFILYDDTDLTRNEKRLERQTAKRDEHSGPETAWNQAVKAYEEAQEEAESTGKSLDSSKEEELKAAIEKAEKKYKQVKQYLDQFDVQISATQQAIKKLQEMPITSHVGFIKDISPISTGEMAGKERWATFDGGQAVGSKGDGAMTRDRIYDPTDNILVIPKGDVPTYQDDHRPLLGWVDVGKLIAKQKTAND